MHSYDPYKSSRIIDHEPSASHAKITVHRNTSVAKSSTKATQPGGTARPESRRNTPAQPRANRNGSTISAHGKSASRRSLASMRSIDSVIFKRPATARHKRGVEFSHVRRRSALQNDAGSSAEEEVVFVAGEAAKAVSISSVHPEKIIKRSTAESSNSKTRSQEMPDNTATHWKDELRKISSSVAKDCDDAFNSSLLLPQPSTASFLNYQDDGEAISHERQSVIQTKPSSRPWETRPLPPPPTTKHRSLLEVETAFDAARKQREAPQAPPKTRMHRAIPEDAAPKAPRRVVSAPIYAQYSTQHGLNNLDSIREGPKEDGQTDDVDKHRIVSAPADYSTPYKKRQDLEYLAQHENTIRLVDSPTAKRRHARAPEPLQVPRKPIRGDNTPARYRKTLAPVGLAAEEGRSKIHEDEPSFSSQNSSTTSKKRSMWFKRTSRNGSLEESLYAPGDNKGAAIVRVDSKSSSNSHSMASKRKGFNFAFWRNSSEEGTARFYLNGE